MEAFRVRIRADVSAIGLVSHEGEVPFHLRRGRVHFEGGLPFLHGHPREAPHVGDPQVDPGRHVLRVGLLGLGELPDGLVEFPFSRREMPIFVMMSTRSAAGGEPSGTPRRLRRRGRGRGTDPQAAVLVRHLPLDVRIDGVRRRVGDLGRPRKISPALSYRPSSLYVTARFSDASV